MNTSDNVLYTEKKELNLQKKKIIIQYCYKIKQLHLSKKNSTYKIKKNGGTTVELQNSFGIFYHIS